MPASNATAAPLWLRMVTASRVPYVLGEQPAQAAVTGWLTGPIGTTSEPAPTQSVTLRGHNHPGPCRRF